MHLLVVRNIGTDRECLPARPDNIADRTVQAGLPPGNQPHVRSALAV